MQKWISPLDLGQEELLLLLGAEVHDGGSDRVDGEHRHRRAGAHRLVEEDELLDGRPPLPAPLLGPADAEPAVLAHPADDPAHGLTDAVRVGELLLDLGRQQLGVVRAQLLTERFLVFGVADLHVEHVIVRFGPAATHREAPNERRVPTLSKYCLSASTEMTNLLEGKVALVTDG